MKFTASDGQVVEFEDSFIAPLAESSRLLIGGGPKTGKSMLAEALASIKGVPVKSSDSLITTHDWSAASEEVSHWFDAEGEWIVEGVAVPRALRKWFARNPNGAPSATIVWLQHTKALQSGGQAVMHKGVNTVWSQVLPVLTARKVPFINRDQLHTGRRG